MVQESQERDSHKEILDSLAVHLTMTDWDFISRQQITTEELEKKLLALRIIEVFKKQHRFLNMTPSLFCLERVCKRILIHVRVNSVTSLESFEAFFMCKLKNMSQAAFGLDRFYLKEESIIERRWQKFIGILSHFHFISFFIISAAK